MDNTEILKEQIKSLNAKVDSLQDQLFDIIRLLQEQNYLTISANTLAPEKLRIDAFNRAMDTASMPEYRINKENEEQESLGSVIR